MTIPRMCILASLTDRQLDAILDRLVERRAGRPWSRPLRQRVLIVCAALRTNLTFRELAAVFRISKSAAHRMVMSLVPQLAAIATRPASDRRWSWIVALQELPLLV